jgi:hypothetical protein
MPDATKWHENISGLIVLLIIGIPLLFIAILVAERMLLC